MNKSTSVSYQDILIEKRPNRVGLIQLNRPKALNALRDQLMGELVDAASKFDLDPDVGAIVITGSERAFSAGADIGEMADATPISLIQKRKIERWHRLRAVRKPIIAAVSGWALGGGCELAMMCDIIVASESAKFGQPEISIGVIPGAGGTQRLVKAIGKSLAMEVVLNDRKLSAEEAMAYGLASRVVPVERYLDEAITLAAEIAARAPIALQFAKQAINKSFDVPLSEGLHYEEYLFYQLFASEDQKEGMAAFVEKRKAEWQGK